MASRFCLLSGGQPTSLSEDLEEKGSRGWEQGASGVRSGPQCCLDQSGIQPKHPGSQSSDQGQVVSPSTGWLRCPADSAWVAVPTSSQNKHPEPCCPSTWPQSVFTSSDWALAGFPGGQAWDWAKDSAGEGFGPNWSGKKGHLSCVLTHGRFSAARGGHKVWGHWRFSNDTSYRGGSL